MDNPNNIILISFISAFVSTLGAIAAIGINLYKLRAERNKTEAEGDSAIGAAADSIATGAKTSNDLLLRRLEEMEQREEKRDEREADLLRKVTALEASLADWQNWARRLVHQLKSHGMEPVPFKPLPKAEPKAGS
jgi:hypothetical protein